MLSVFEKFHEGYNEMTNMKTLNPEMMMDIGVQVIDKDEVVSFMDFDKESAFLLLSGKITFKWGNDQADAERYSLFDENPAVLHVPKGVKVVVEAEQKSEILVQKTTNDAVFDTRYYSPKDCRCDIFGENVWNDTARRIVRTVFDYSNAPYSNMVLGEVINFPGKWSSYIPHGHPQPEVYFYRFDKEQGFGAGFIGDNAYKIRHNSILCIPGGPTHPQASAPGYAMYYAWMIRHLPDNPWTSRIDDEKHAWLLKSDAVIWPEK